MPIYVKAIGSQVIKYPYSLGDMLADNPDVSFAQPISLETAANFNTFLVEEMPQPDYDPVTQNLISTNPDFVGGVWVQTWAIEDATTEEIAERLAFRRQQMVVSEFQAKAALLLQGMMPQVEALIEHPDTDAIVKLAWATARDYRRTSPSILGMAQALGWTDQQLDDLFLLAATLDA